MPIIPLEENVMDTLAVCSNIVLCGWFIFVLYKMIKDRNSKYIWFLFQIITHGCAMYLIINLLSGNVDVPSSKRSEEYSLILGKAGILWAISILFFMIGFSIVTKSKKSLN